MNSGSLSAGEMNVGGSGAFTQAGGAVITSTTLGVDVGGTYTLNGGSLSAALSLICQGRFTWGGGTLAVASAQLQSGGLVTLTPGRNKALHLGSLSIDPPPP